VRSLAFPSLSTGAFGYPMEEAADIAFRTVLDREPSLQSVKTIRFVLFSEKDRELHQGVLDRLRE
jgi:O-acetyl-ADP-ribose deacetylase (regulator of RNase III)